MQDFDVLRSRVEATARRLSSAQAERHEQTQSLVEILRQLEERHAAHEQQLAWYRDRLGPLEQANRQLVGLMERLLDLIDSGFGDDSLEPLRKASRMASAMLAQDLAIAGSDPDDNLKAEAEEPAVFEQSESAGADESELEDTEGFFEESTAGVTDLEMEEDALISLEDLLEMASEGGGEEPRWAEMVAPPGQPAAPSPPMFESVSAAELAHEADAEAAETQEELPELVRVAVAAARQPDAPAGSRPAPVDATAPEDEARAIAAIAQALEEETSSESAPPPAPSDIRALLLRVEALAKRAEAMRLAQQGGDASGNRDARPGAPAKGGQKRTGAAA